MAAITLYNQQGQSVGNVELSDVLFSVEVQPALVHEAVVTQEANSRQVLAHTKDRSEVNGSGKKPWRQKGTGRARHGSRYSPIWRGGGITFGPTKWRNFARKMNRKARRKALAMVLSQKVTNDRFMAVEHLSFAQPRAKEVLSVLKALPYAEAKTLLILEPSNAIVARAVRNVQGIQTISAHSLNVVDLLKSDRVIATKEALDHIAHVYAKTV